MSDASDLWDSVVANYDAPGLLLLTNPRNRAATTINTTNGTNAAEAVLGLWSALSQTDYDASDPTHVEIARRGVIATLWDRGGSTASIAKVRWDSVFGKDDGLIARLTQTSSRGRIEPETNSQVHPTDESVRGQSVRGWSDRRAIPDGIMPDPVVYRPGEW